MKKLLIFLISFVSFFSSATFAQKYYSLDGIENKSGETILLFRKGTDFYSYNSVASINIVTRELKHVIDGHRFEYPGTEDSKTIDDFEFFPDGENFMAVGLRIYPDAHSYIARNDTNIFAEVYIHERVDISKQDPSKVYVLGGAVGRSFDGGYTFPADSLLHIPAFSKVDFDEETYFGFNERQLVKIDGAGERVVDTSNVIFNMYTRFIYDDYDKNSVYLVTKSYDNYILLYSGDVGETWSNRYTAPKPIFVDIDTAGVVYIGDRDKIFVSDNYGSSFTEYRTLIKDVIGVYKKPGADLLYAATEDMIYEITPDGIKEISSASHRRLPLAIGNQWVYSEGWFPTEGSYDTLSYTVVSDTIMSNGRKYYRIPGNWFYHSEYLREDHLGIYFYDTECEEEQLVYNYNLPVGFDSSWTFFWRSCLNLPMNTVHKIAADTGYILGNPQLITQFSHDAGVDADVFSINISSNIGFSGLTMPGWDRTYYATLIGYKLYGNTYGTTVDIKDEQPDIKSFTLQQNYPNPFNPATTISYNLPFEQIVKLRVYDIIGKEIAVLVNERQSAGSHKIEFDASKLSSGVYIYKLQAGDFVQARKMILMK